MLRSHLLDRLSTSIEILESGDQGALLNVLASPFQGVRSSLRTPVPGAPEEERTRLLDRCRAAPRALDGIRRSLEDAASRELLPPRSQAEAVARQADRLAGEAASWEPLVRSGAEKTEETGRAEGPAPAGGALERDLRAAAQDVAQAAAGLSRYLREELVPRAGAREGVGPERHARWVRRLLGTSIEPAEVYQWAREELRTVVRAQDAIAVEVLGSGARAADLDAVLRRDPARGIRPRSSPAGGRRWPTRPGTPLSGGCSTCPRDWGGPPSCSMRPGAASTTRSRSRPRPARQDAALLRGGGRDGAALG